MMQKPIRRKKYLINKPMQFKFIAFIVVIVLIYSLSLIYSLHLFGESASIATRYIANENPSIAQAIEKRNRNSIIYAALMLTFNGMAVVILIIIATHKVAGPIYRIEQSMKEVQNGKFSANVKFRKGDELSHLADSFNSTIRSIKKRAGEDQASLLSMSGKIESLINSLGSGDDSANTRNELQQVNQQLANLKQRCQDIIDG